MLTLNLLLKEKHASQGLLVLMHWKKLLILIKINSFNRGTKWASALRGFFLVKLLYLNFISTIEISFNFSSHLIFWNKES